VIRVYDEDSNVIETHEHPGEFKEWWVCYSGLPDETTGATNCPDMQGFLAVTSHEGNRIRQILSAFDFWGRILVRW
jgi:hypothetical protein